MSNENFETLLISIDTYCKELRKKPDPMQMRDTVRQVRQVCNQFLPELSKSIEPTSPDYIYVKKMIDFAVAGIQDKILLALWETYYLNGGQISDIAQFMATPNRSVYNRLRVFPSRVTSQIWEKELELSKPENANQLQPHTLPQQCINILRERFGLTNREAEILMAYCEEMPHMGRQAIADALSISKNTLKSHQKHICRKMKTLTMNDAANKARSALEEKLGERWKKSNFTPKVT